MHGVLTDKFNWFLPSTQVPWIWMHVAAVIMFVGDVILLITWQIVFEPRAVKVLREVSIFDRLMESSPFRKANTTQVTLISRALHSGNTVKLLCFFR